MARADRLRYAVAALILACAAIVGCDALPRNQPASAPTASVPAPPPTPDSPASVARWYHAALDEGQVRVYADLSPRETEDLSRLFARRHPGVRIDWHRGADREMVRRALAEGVDGEARFDVLVGDAATALKSAGLAERWFPPEAAALRPEYVDPDGAWHGLAVTYHVLQYNTEQVPFAERPTRYEDLADPRYSGRLAVEEESLTWLAGLVERQGRQETVDQLKPLADQGVVLRRGPALLSTFVAAGRQAVAISNRLDAVERDRRAGAKTAWVGINPVVVQPTAVVLAARAPRPNGARLVANFLLTADAQVALAVAGRVPSRVDVDPEPQSLVRGLRVHVALPPEGDAERDLRQLYADLWRPS